MSDDEKKIDQLTTDLSTEAAKVIELAASLDEFRALVVAADSENAKLTQSLSELQLVLPQIEELKRENASLGDLLAEQKILVEELSAQELQSKKDIGDLLLERNDLIADNDELKGKVELGELLFREQAASLDESVAKVESLEALNADLTERIASISSTSDGALQSLYLQLAEFDSLKVSNRDLTAELKSSADQVSVLNKVRLYILIVCEFSFIF